MHNCGSSWGSKGMEGEFGRLEVTKSAFLKHWHGWISQCLQENLRSQAHSAA